MSRADDLRSEFEVAVKIAELEDAVAEQKPPKATCSECGRRKTVEKSDDLRAAQEELRQWRYVLRLPRDRDKAAAAGNDTEAARLDALIADLAALKEN